MTADEKAAPIPAEVRATADATAATWHLLSYPSKVVLSDDIARAIMQDRVDRASQEEREADVRELAILSEYDGFARQCGVSSTARTKRLEYLRARLRGDAS